MERIPAIIICLIFENRLNAISLKFEVRVDRVDFVLGDQDELIRVRDERLSEQLKSNRIDARAARVWLALEGNANSLDCDGDAFSFGFEFIKVNVVNLIKFRYD